MIKDNFHLTEKQAKALKTLADETGLSKAEHVRRALDAYLEKIAKKEKGGT